ncbi:MAG TPA: alpha/beta hydrolase [Dehalococcoidia bacterium]|nr:alpha/beta hydrolase [Dehalococcoidia bacterium]
MSVIFVHGVPETEHLWDGVRERLARKDTVAVSLPGFGVDTPDGFACTKEEYVTWLTREVEKAGGPVDIVGHDWGALMTARLVQVRPDLVRTWTIGGAAIDEGYDWHPMAKMWQTPDLGEQVMAGFTVDAMVTALTAEGVPEEAARQVASRVDDRMKASILPLYRSAVTFMKDWHADVEKMSARPGLMIWGEKDPYMQIDFAKRMAQRAGARLVTVPGSHWWPVQFPAKAAAYLEEFWASA